MSNSLKQQKQQQQQHSENANTSMSSVKITPQQFENTETQTGTKNCFNNVNSILNPYLQAYIAEHDATHPVQLQALQATGHSEQDNSGTFVRIPVCLELLEALDSVEKRNKTQLADVIAAGIAQERCQVDPRVLEADSDFELFLFNNRDFAKNFGASDSIHEHCIDVNWKGVILKLHQALYYSDLRQVIASMYKQGKLETVKGPFVDKSYFEFSDSSDTSSETDSDDQDINRSYPGSRSNSPDSTHLKRSQSDESLPETFRSPTQTLEPLSVPQPISITSKTQEQQEQQQEQQQEKEQQLQQEKEQQIKNTVNVENNTPPTTILSPTSASPLPQSSLGSVVLPQDEENQWEFPGAQMLAASSFTPPSFEDLDAQPSQQQQQQLTQNQSDLQFRLNYLPSEFEFVIFWGEEPLVEDEDEDEENEKKNEENKEENKIQINGKHDNDMNNDWANHTKVNEQSVEQTGNLNGESGNQSSKLSSYSSEKDNFIELSDGILISLKWVLLALNTKGYHDVSFVQLVISSINSVKNGAENSKLMNQLQSLEFKTVFQPNGIDSHFDYESTFINFFHDYNNSILLDDNYQEYVSKMLSSNEKSVMKSLQQLEKDIVLCNRGKNIESLNNAERLLISLQGHVNSLVREWAVRMLNIVYDGHEWQRQVAFKPVITNTSHKNALKVHFKIPKADNPSHVSADTIFLQCSVPSPLRYSQKSLFLLQQPKVTETKEHWIIDLRVYRFRKSGFFDYRVVHVTSDAQLKPLVIGSKFAHGRFIVHPNVKDETIHHVWVNMHQASWSSDRSKLTGAGSFDSITDAIPGYAKSGVTTLHLMGCMERYVSNPYAPHDRAHPKSSLGGTKGFKRLIGKAQEHNIKIMVDSTSKVALYRPHRKYSNLSCLTLDNQGRLVPHYGTNGHDKEWKDSEVLNYRKKDVWDLLVEDICHWSKLHVNGIFMESAHTWPILLEPDLTELMRRDCDSEFHYSYQDILDANVVISNKRAKRTLGYWGTTTSATYANPLFIKLAKTLWSKNPQFMMMGECKWNRERSLILSGVIPSSNKLNNVVGQLLSEQTQPKPHRTAKSIVQQWYKDRPKIPPGSIIVFPSSGHTFQYPHLQFGLSAFAYISLLFMLPEVPMTALGERDASQFKVNFDKCILSRMFKPFPQEDALREHYILRAAIRAKHSVLRHGEIRLLTPRVKGQEIEDGLAFIRYMDDEFIICAVNTAPHNATFYVDMERLKDTYPFNDHKANFQLEDLLVPGTQRQHYTGYELIHEPHYVKLPSFGSMMWKGQVMPPSDATTRVVLNHSISRLQMIFDANGDPVHNYVYRYIVSSLKSIQEFKQCLENLTSIIVSDSAVDLLGKLVQQVLYHVSRDKTSESQCCEARVYYLLTKLAKGEKSNAQKCALKVLEENTLGPIVFVTPEIAPWSKIGGVAVMVDELTQDLAYLGLKVKVISPYYNYDRDGHTGYLEKDGVKHLRNITTFIGGEQVSIGLHYLYRNGVEYYFLHNFTYFPSPYHTGSPSHQLQMVVLMAKASLEMMCQLRILPALIVTNDWFTGLTPGYVRCGEFGSVFSGVTFFHLIHNLEEGYKGLIYPDEPDLLRGIHGLPEHFLVDHLGAPRTLNTSRCALLTSNQWATVSKSYRDDLMRTNPLAYLLKNFPSPFAYSNGIRVNQRLQKLQKVASSHEEAKKQLQEKYFGYSDPSVPVFSFVGRITVQKGVHLILNAVKDLVESLHGKIMIIVGGLANKKEKYAAHCAWQMNSLRYQYPRNFWADPDAYFTDGSLANLGSDYGVLPSLFEPSGIVQQEYFVAGTPVIAFSTGGLKDTVFEFDPTHKTGNGFMFLAHKHPDFVYAVKRAISNFHNPDNYASLRKNARASVLDTLVVARAWGREFYRLRKRIWPFDKYEEQVQENDTKTSV